MNKGSHIIKLLFLVIIFILSIYHNTPIMPMEQQVELSVNSKLLGKNDVLEVTLMVNNNNLAYINDDALYNFFRPVEEPKYIYDNSGSLTIKYKLNPISIGRFTLKNIKVFLNNGDILIPNEITISIVEGSIYNNERIQQDDNNELPAEKRTFIKIITDKDIYYKGETIILSTYIYSIYPIDNNYEYYKDRPTLSKDFWEPGFHDYEVVLSTTSTEKIDQIEYEKKLIDRRILFPKFSGDYTFGPYKWKVQFGEKVRDYKNYILDTNTLNIIVKPLPEKNQPDNYIGSTGNFEISSEITGFDYKNQNDIPVYTGNTFVKYILKLSGRGNPDIVAEPNFQLSEESFEIISVNTIPKERFSDDGYYFTKVYEYLLRPIKEGIIKIPKIDYTYFDIKNELYKTISTDDYAIFNQQKINNNNTDRKEIVLQKIKQNLKSIKKPKKIDNKNPYILSGNNSILIISYLLFILILIPISFVVYKKRKHKDENPEKTIQNKAYNNFITSFNYKMNIHYDDYRDIYKSLYKIINKYISERFNLSEGKINTNELVRIFKKHKIQNEIINNFNDYYNILTTKIYSGSISDDNNNKSNIEKIKQLIKNIEDNIE